jgi:hypothetical protein
VSERLRYIATIRCGYCLDWQVDGLGVDAAEVMEAAVLDALRDHMEGCPALSGQPPVMRPVHMAGPKGRLP